jgi:hypothetical protein
MLCESDWSRQQIACSLTPNTGNVAETASVDARDDVDAFSARDQPLQLVGSRRQPLLCPLIVKEIAIRNEIREELVQRGSSFLKYIRRQFHHEDWTDVAKQIGRASKNVALEPVNIKLDQLYPAIRALGQNAVKASRLR